MLPLSQPGLRSLGRRGRRVPPEVSAVRGPMCRGRSAPGGQPPRRKSNTPVFGIPGPFTGSPLPLGAPGEGSHGDMQPAEGQEHEKTEGLRAAMDGTSGTRAPPGAQPEGKPYPGWHASGNTRRGSQTTRWFRGHHPDDQPGHTAARENHPHKRPPTPPKYS